METIVYILFMLVCFSFLLKQTFVNTLQLSITAVAAMVFTGFAWHVAILQSSTEIAAWLANTDLVRGAEHRRSAVDGILLAGCQHRDGRTRRT